MAVVRDKFTAGNDGNTLSTANSDADSVVATGGTNVIDVDEVYSISRSVLSTATSTSGGVYWTRTINSTTTLGADMYIRFTSLPSGECTIILYMSGSTQCIRLNLTSTGQLRIRDAAAGGGANIWTSTATMSTGTWYRISVFATQHASTGTVRAAFYTGGGTTPLDDSTLLTGRNTGVGAYGQIRWGTKASTSTTSYTANIDDYAYDEAASGLLPVEAVSPVLPSDPQTVSYYVFLDLSATTFGTGPVEFSATPSTNVVDTPTGLYLPVNADGSVTSYTVTATDTGAGNATDDMPFSAQLPTDIIESMIWDGSAWT